MLAKFLCRFTSAVILGWQALNIYGLPTILVTFLFKKCRCQYFEASILGQFIVSFWMVFFNLSEYRFFLESLRR